MKSELFKIVRLLSLLACCVYFFRNPNVLSDILTYLPESIFNALINLNPPIPNFADFK